MKIEMYTTSGKGSGNKLQRSITQSMNPKISAVTDFRAPQEAYGESVNPEQTGGYEAVYHIDLGGENISTVYIINLNPNKGIVTLHARTEETIRETVSKLEELSEVKLTLKKNKRLTKW